MNVPDARPLRAPATQLTLARVALGALVQAAIGVVLIAYAQGTESLRSLLAIPAAASMAAGLVLGSVMAGLQAIALRRSPSWRAFSQRAIAGTVLSPRDIVLIGLVIGVAEELLFRAALQPLLGVWGASLLFALLHWNYAALRGPRSDIPWSLLAIATIFTISVALGLLYERYGLAAAITAHTSYDIIVLFVYRRLFRW